MYWYLTEDLILISQINDDVEYNFLFMYLSIQFWLCWVFIAAHSLSLVAASRGYSSSGRTACYYGGFSCGGAWAPGCVDFSRVSELMVPELSCHTACYKYFSLIFISRNFLFICSCRVFVDFLGYSTRTILPSANYSLLFPFQSV